MGRKKGWGVSFSGFDDMAERLNKLGGSLEATTEEALSIIPDIVNPPLEEAIRGHRKSGDTERSLVEGQKVQWEVGRAYIQAGFDIANGGLASIFLMYGTPSHPPANQYGPAQGTVRGVDKDARFYSALYGSATRKQIAEAQERIFAKAIERAGL